MKSTTHGMKGLWHKAKYLFNVIFKNCILELAFLLLGILWLLLLHEQEGMHQWITNYFSESRCSGVISYAAVIIGIYVTVWSIFATSASRINAELLKKRVEGQLFFLIAIGLVEAFFTIVLCVFVPNCIEVYAELMMFLISLTTISFIKFIIILMKVTKLNIQYIVQEIDSNNAQRTDIKIKLDEIYQQFIAKQKK